MVIDFTIVTPAGQGTVNITERVQGVVTQSGLSDGMCYIWVPHTTAGLFANEDADPDVVRDIMATLNRLVPVHGAYRHTEGNSHAHIKAALVGNGLMLPVTEGRLNLGTWQGIFLAEFDGPRRRRVVVSVMGEPGHGL
jgi:secondary thiamine-phosphate synthase enzyme